MASVDEVQLAKNQDLARVNELDVEGEARLYRAFRHFWHPVAFSHEVGEEEPIGATLCEHSLVVTRLDGEVCVFNDLCAHRGTALSLGNVVGDGSMLRCKYHGWQYDKRGMCVLAPQRPDLSDQLRARVKKYNAVEAYGMVWVCLADEPEMPLPEFPMYDDPSFTKALLPCDDWKCAAPRRTENYCDLSHLAFVHDGTLGDINHPEVPDHDVYREGVCLRVYAPFVEPAGTGKYKSLGIETEVTGAQDVFIYMPLTVRMELRLDLGYNYVLFFHPTPLGPKTTRNFTVGAANYPGAEDDLKKEIIDFQAIVYGEDKPVIESQRPEQLPEDLSWEMYLKGVDKFHLEYRRWLVELAQEVEPDGASA